MEKTDPTGRYETLIHESWHAAYEDWTELYAESYADEVLRCIREVLEKKGP